MNGFRHGRTECVRGMTTAAVAFCKLMLQPAGTTLQQRASKLRVALDVHSKNTARSAKGQGYDRHLLVSTVLGSALLNRIFVWQVGPSASSPMRTCFALIL